MNHEVYEDMISAKLDGLLTEEEEAELAGHLASCPDCRRARREMEAAHWTLLAASPPPPEGLTDRILENLPAQPRKRSPWVRKAAPLAAAAVFALAVLGITKTVANFHDVAGSNAAAEEAVMMTEEATSGEDPEDSGKEESLGAFGKDKKEDAATEASNNSAAQKPVPAAVKDKDKAQTTAKDKDKNKQEASDKDTDKKPAESRETDAEPAKAEAETADTKPDTAQDARTEEDNTTTAAGGMTQPSEAVETEEEATAETAPAEAAEPEPPAPAPPPAVNSAETETPQETPAAVDDEDPEAPPASTITWQQAKERLNAYLDGAQDDLVAQGMDKEGKHWLFTTGGKQYAVDIHTGAVTQR